MDIGDDIIESTTTPVTGSDDVIRRLETRFSGKEDTPLEKTGEDSANTPVDAVPDNHSSSEDGGEPQKAEGEPETQAPSEEGDIEVDPALVAQILGLDENGLIVDEDGVLYLQTKVDGELGKVTVKDLLKSYQTEAHVNNKSIALAEDRKQFELIKEAGIQEIKKSISEAAAVTQLMEQQLTSRFNSINWEALRVQNPAEWTAKRQEFTDQANLINQAKSQLGALIQGQYQQDLQAMSAAKQEALLREAEAVRAKLPSWSDPEVARQEHAALGNFLRDTYGFAPTDLDGVEDHRVLLMAIDAMKYKASQLGAEAATKKIKALPKLVKPGTRTNSDNPAKVLDDKRKIRLKKSGSVHDAAQLILGRMKGA
jgi:hypothetical protein